MSAVGDDDIDRLMAEAAKLPHGPSRTAMVEEAVRIADSRNDLPQAFKCRLELVSAASSGGQPDVKLVAFSWCLSQFDRDKKLFGGRATEIDLLWKYKWIAGALPAFHQISREQIAATVEDFRRRYMADGSTMHAVYDEECSIAISMGDKPAAASAQKLLAATKRDMFSNCAACVQDRLISYHRCFDRHGDAVDAAAPILSGRLKCGTVPHRTYPKLMMSLFNLNRLAEAMHYHRIGYPMVASNPGHTAYVDDHIRFLALTGNGTRALRLTHKHLRAALAYVSLNTRYAFLRDVRLLFRLLKAEGVKTATLSLPDDHPLASSSGRLKVSDFLDWLDADCRRIAALYDSRNGNEDFTRGLETDGELAVKPYPFRKPGENRKAGGDRDE
jgi:hypothetical protein